MRLKLTVEYDGTSFHGWAAQPGLPTIEAAVRKALGETVAAQLGVSLGEHEPALAQAR